MFELTDKDKIQLKEKGISEKKLLEQINLISTGVPYIDLVKPCTVGDGIKILTGSEMDEYIKLYQNSLDRLKPVKFVPSSGAASRMFSLLNKVKLDYDSFINRVDSGSVSPDEKDFLGLLENIDKFAFYDELDQVIAESGNNLKDLISDRQYKLLIDYLLTGKGLNYLNYPKGLIKFHAYGNHSRTAFEEHLVEAINYSTSGDNVSRVHFTILQEHEDLIKKYIDDVLDIYTSSVNKFDISYSFQSPDTDVIALDFNNIPLRDEKQRLIFRPGGHGALLQNLNDLNNEIIFVKNIDNVVPDYLKEQTYKYKKALAGLLIKLKTTSDNYLNMIRDGLMTEDNLDGVFKFLENELNVEIDENLSKEGINVKREYIFNCLNRPLRICGVVKNEGEPGGGPFWVTGSDGKLSKQIVESAQVDMDDPVQNAIWQSSTHFNPVDLVCSIYDFEGRKFDLNKFVDMNTVFITKKSKDGIDIKSMELPGLWNGSMAYWNTVFVEVPLITFNPVKTVMDLLKKEHLQIN